MRRGDQGAVRRRMGQGWAGWLIVATLSGLSARPAAAHPQFALSTVNRYGKLVLVSPRQARVFFTLMVGDVPAQAMRQEADRNRDGTVDEGEQQILASLLRERVARGVHLYRGEAELTLAWERAPLKLDNPAVTAGAFAYELTTTLALPGNDQPVPGSAAKGPAADELRYDDRVELDPVGELELLVEEGPGMRVLQVQSSLIAPKPAGGATRPQLLTQWAGPPRSSLSDRSIRVRFVAVPANLAARRRPSLFPIRWPWLLGGLAATLALIAGFRIRRVGRPS
jgi:hypothetical protein